MNSSHLKWLVAAIVSGCVLSPLQGQPPGLLSYQGRVLSGATNFSGTGQFKFALVSGDGASSYWSNDNTSSGGSQPTASISLAVTNGLFSVQLGDPALGMGAVAATTFLNPDVRVRVWFNDGIAGFQQLAPDRRVVSTGSALVAATVPNGSITADKLAPGVGVAGGGLIASANYEDPSLLTAGYALFGGTQVVGNVWIQRNSYAQPLPRTTPVSGAVWTGAEMIFWGDFAQPNGARYNPQSDSWTTLLASAPNAPGARTNYTCVWTGEEVLVWGGGTNTENTSNIGGSAPFITGSRYRPSTNQWTPMSSPANFIPGFAGREWHTAVWTGTEMIVWGGNVGPSLSSDTATGARYNPASNTWTTVSNTGAPAARHNHTAVWTGTRMIVWGGGNSLSDGGIYDPATDSWSPMADSAAPGSIGLPGRTYPESVWTGTEMIVWGGYRAGGDNRSDGGRYNPTTNTWAMVPAVAIAGRFGHKLAWTGREMLVFGGRNIGGGNLNTGAAYTPDTASWTSFPSANAPSARAYFPAVWNGRELLACAAQGATPDVYSFSPRRFYYLYQR